MKKFNFSLETLLKYRINIEKMRKEEWALARKMRMIEEDKLKSLTDDEKAKREELNEMTQGRTFDIYDYLYRAKYINQLLYYIKLQKKVVEEKKEEEKIALNKWIESRKNKKALENYRKKLWKNYLMEMDKEEQKIVDDIFVNSRRKK
jgi:flagellar FliJ protein